MGPVPNFRFPDKPGVNKKLLLPGCNSCESFSRLRSSSIGSCYGESAYPFGSGENVVQRLVAPREAANILGISYPTLKQWIYRKKIKTAKTPGGHHRVPESEIDRLLPKKLERGDLSVRRGNFRKISGRNQLIGRVVALKFSGLLAQVTLAIGGQHVTSIITADAARELRLKVGERAAVLFKSTEVMILCL